MSMISRLRVHILDADEVFVAEIRRGVSSEEIDVSTSTGLERLDEIAESHDVVLLDESVTGLAPTPVVRRLLMRRPSLAIVLTGGVEHVLAFSEGIAAGAAAVLRKPYTAADLTQVVPQLRNWHGRGVEGSAVRSGWLVAVYGPKGGVGRTTVAAGLALALARRRDTSAALVDLNLQFGDVAAALDLAPAGNLLDLLGVSDLAPQLLDSVLVTHSSGLRVLAAPPDLSASAPVDASQAVAMLDHLRVHFDFIVCDLWASLEDLTLEVLRAADRVVVVTTPELASVRHVRRMLDATAADLALDARSIYVANQLPRPGGLAAADVARIIGSPLCVSIPLDIRGVSGANDRGEALFDSGVARGVTSAISSLADRVAADLAPTPVAAVAS